MSNYQFAPSPDRSTWEQHQAYWEGGFTASELDEIISVGESLIPLPATVGAADGSAKVDPEYRRSNTSWISQSHLSWVYDRMAYIARQVNGQFFDLDLFGFVEDFQFTVYDASVQGHYDWHIDKGVGGSRAPRKLSMVLQLSDPADYDGGVLELNTGTITQAVKERGRVYLFPSYVLHRVTPVTRGIRKSLVVWAAGPKFR